MTGRLAPYQIEPRRDPPPGYPRQAVPDTFHTTPFASDYEVRRAALLDYYNRIPAALNFKAAFHELARLARGQAPHLGILEAALDFIDARRDCADFVIHSILRILYDFEHLSGRLLPSEFLARARRTVLGFKYWPDEPGQDSMCTWTENHQVLLAAAAYLAGQRYPDEVFTNSEQLGREKMILARRRILRWLDLRFRTGFSEWLSNVYYDEDLAALINLVDLCQDEEIRTRAAAVIDLILYDMALNSFQGVFGSTHGRTYEDTKKWAGAESTAAVHKLMFGTGIFSPSDNMSAVLFALSKRYRLPGAIFAAANDSTRPERVNRQRMGLRIEEAQHWGLSTTDFEDGMVFLSMEAYAHPDTFDLVLKMFDAYGWWENDFFQPFAERRRLLKTLQRTHLLRPVARRYQRDLTRNLRSEVNIYTYHTPDYMLSTAQDYRPGYGGDQQHIWQATLGPDVVCLTTHPARRTGPSPNYWVGSGVLPRCAQVKNVVIAVYDLDVGPALYLKDSLPFTHAWLPQERFQQVIERGGWIFARFQQSYLALRSQHAYRWLAGPGEIDASEVVAPGKRNIWICELGRAAVDGSFGDFVERIAAAEVAYRGRSVTYHSPTQGVLSFGWQGPLRHNGEIVPLSDYPRYDNPYSQAAFPADEVKIDVDGTTWTINPA
jgi:hypothetical protein